MSARKLAAGDIVDARCTKCRTVLNHTIVAMVGERVVRVQCNTCGGTHNYHGPTETKAPASGGGARKAAAPRTAAKKTEIASAEEWKALMERVSANTRKPYDMNASYRVNNVVEHPVFGEGVVTQVQPKKVEVLFESGRKLLRAA